MTRRSRARPRAVALPCSGPQPSGKGWSSPASCPAPQSLYVPTLQGRSHFEAGAACTSVYLVPLLHPSPSSHFNCVFRSSSEVLPSFLSVGVSVSNPPSPFLRLSRSLGLRFGLSSPLAHFRFLCLASSLSLLSAPLRAHTPHSPVYDIPRAGRWAGLQQRGGERGRRSLPPSC